MVLVLPAPTLAQSSAELELLTGNYVRVVTGISEIDNYQINDPSGSLSATASDESGNVEIGRDLLVTSAVSGSLAVTSNSITGTALSNEATNRINATTTPALDESSVIGNLQVNERDLTATSDEASIYIDIEIDEALLESASGSGSIAGSIASLDNGSATLDGNRIRTSATGNTSTNTITVGDAVSILGGSGDASLTVTDTDFFADPTASGFVETTDLSAAADLAIANAQINDAVSGAIAGGTIDITSSIDDASIYIELDGASGSIATLSNNALSAAARGNVATSTIETESGALAATIDASVAMGNLQANTDLNLTAEVSGSIVSIATGASIAGGGITLANDGSTEVDYGSNDSTLEVANNSISASAYANQAVQTISLSANDVNGAQAGLATISDGNGVGGVFESESLSVEAQIAIGGQQLLDDTNVTATVAGNQLGVSVVGDVSDDSAETSTIIVADNALDATAVGNIAVSSAVSIEGNTVGGGIGVASLQDAWTTDVEAETVNNSIGSLTTESVSGATIEIADNSMSANSTVNLADSSIRIQTNTFVASENGGVAIDFNDDSPSGFGQSGNVTFVSAAASVLNEQEVSGVSSTATTVSEGAEGVNLGALVTVDLQDSTLEVTGNDTTSTALINDASTSITLSANEIDTSGMIDFASVAAAASSQAVYESSVTAGTFVDLGVRVGTDVSGSTVMVSDNTISASATANRSTGTVLTLNLNNADTDANSFTDQFDGDDEQFAASFLAISAQDISSGSVVATLDEVSGGFSVDSSEIRIDVGDDIWGPSMVSAADNELLADATGNNAVTTLDLNATGSIDSTLGVVNLQNSNATDINVTIGVAGSIGSPGTTETATGVVSTVDVGDDTGTVSGTVSDVAGTNVWSGNVGGLTETQLTGFLNDYGTQPGFAYDPGTGDVSFEYTGPGTGSIALNYTFDILQNQYEYDLSGLSASGLTDFQSAYPGATITGTTATLTTTDASGTTDVFSVTFGAEPAVDPAGGIFIAVNDEIQDSTIEIADNTIAGTATGQTAVNTLSVAALDLAPTTASGARTDDSEEVTATVSLLNLQNFDSGSVSSDVIGTFAIDGNVEGVVNDSTLLITGNSQSATATANTVRNTISVDADTFDSSIGSLNEQQLGNGSGTVEANSAMTLSAPMEVSGSTLAITSNTNTAVATGNIAVSTVTLDTNNATSDRSSGAFLDEDDEAFADLALQSDQWVGTAWDSITAVAETDIVNDFRLDSGLNTVDSSITIGSNSTVAEATANRVTNTLSIDGNNVASSAAIWNEQDNNATTSAQASSFIAVELTGDSIDPALSNSTVAMTDNRTAALAFGQVATNQMTVSATNLTGGPLNATSDLNGTLNGMEAQYGVLNNQENFGNIIAQSEGTVYQVALNDLGTADDMAAMGSSLQLTGNLVQAQAVANVASNSLTVAALSTSDVAVGVTNVQSNSGDVTAYVGETTISIDTVGSINGASVVGSNAVSATAVGNSVSNLINR